MRRYLPLFLLILTLFAVSCGAPDQGAIDADDGSVVTLPDRSQPQDSPRQLPPQTAQQSTTLPQNDGGKAAPVAVERSESAVEAEAPFSADDAAAGSEIVRPAATAVAIVPPNQQPNPDTMLFERSSTNPFIDARDDNLSTFAIDVDTGSYTLMRGYLSDYGALPPVDSVRVEEYVNFFDYRYARPEQNGFAIHIEGAPTPYGESDAYHLVRIGIQGYEPPSETRPDVLLIFVIDVSGSMDQGNRLGLVKESLRLLVNELRPSDRIGLVVYGSNAREIMAPTPVRDGERIMQAIEQLRPEGATNAEEGILLGYRSADRYRLDGEITRLIVLSDGVANVGNTTAETILQWARQGVSLSTFGFGMGNYNDALMEQLADKGDGSYAYVDTLREAQRLFVENLNGTLVTIAKDAKIQVEFNPNVVERYRLLGYENRDIADEDFRNDTVDAGEIGAGHSVTALYELRLTEQSIDSAEAALTVRVRYQEPESGEVVEVARAASPADFAGSFSEASSSFQLAAVVAEYAELLKGSFWAQENTLELLWQDVDRVARSWGADSQVQEFGALVEAATSLSR